MPGSVIEAIQLGIWDFEPKDKDVDQYESTEALPGSNEKLDILAERLAQGYPLWHPSDRLTYAEAREQEES